MVCQGKRVHMITELEQELVDALIRHQTYIDRFGAGLANRVLKLVDSKELEALVISKRKLRKQIKAYIAKEKKNINKAILVELRQMARLELDFMNDLLKASKDLKLGNAQINSIVDNALVKPLVYTNISVDDLYDNAFAKKEQIAVTLNELGATATKSIADVARDFSFAAVQFANAMNAANKTFAFAVANEMRERVYQSSRVVIGVVMSAILDGRTTPFCMDIDGDFFPKGEGPRPPFHPRCRTNGIPRMKDQSMDDMEELLSYRSSIGPGKEYSKGDSKKLRSRRSQIESGKTKVKSAGKSTKSSSNYADFLAAQRKTKQGKQFIMDRLGIKKGKRFIKLIEQGKNPDKLLTEILFHTQASDLDIDGLKKRIKR